MHVSVTATDSPALVAAKGLCFWVHVILEDRQVGGAGSTSWYFLWHSQWHVTVQRTGQAGTAGRIDQQAEDNCLHSGQAFMAQTAGPHHIDSNLI